VPRVFLCESQQRFSVQPVRGGVVVSIPGRQLRMASRPFRLGERFVSGDGALIIDGDFASLVLNNDLSFQTCKRVK
jgi:hypothetical protein